MHVVVVRRDKGSSGEQWHLDVGDSLVTLSTPDGQAMLQWTPVEVSQAVTFPSFSQSIKYTGFDVAGAGYFSFDIDSNARHALRAFANRGIAAGGPAAIRKVMWTALLTTLGGVVVFGLGLVALTRTIQDLNGTSDTAGGGSSHPVGVVTTLVGLGIFCRGVYGLIQYMRLRDLSLDRPPA